MKTAVISGGAGGLGQALSLALQDRGWQVVLLDHDISNVGQTQTQHVIRCDLTDARQLEQCAHDILSTQTSIDLLIYNAGITHIGGFESATEPAHRKVFEVNYFAAVAMARHFLHAIRQSQGTHLAISSVAGFAPLYHRTAYAASKHALEGFFKSLRSEERSYGVDVVIAAPSFVATNPDNTYRDAEGTVRPGSADDGLDVMSPKDAVAEILKGLDRAQPMIPVGRVARLAWWINSLSPRLYQRLMERQIAGGGNRR